MDSIPTELFVALAALVGGWILGGVTHALRYRSDRRQRLARAIAVVRLLSSSGQNYLRTVKTFESGSKDHTQFESLRAISLSKLSDDYTKIESHIDESILTIMDYDPLNIETFYTIIDTTRGLSKRPLKASASEKPEVYEMLLRAVNATFEAKVSAEDRLVRRLAWKIGPAFYVVTVIRMARDKRTQASNIEAMQPMMKKFADAISKI